MSAADLKSIINPRLIAEIADEVRRAHAPFDSAGFLAKSVDGLEALELSARAWQVAEALYQFLPTPFAKAAQVIEASLGPEIEPTGNNGLSPLCYMPHVFFVQKYGLGDFEAAIHLQEELTKRFSAESSIRAFLVKYPERTYARMLQWAKADNPHLRRLASEGTRPRLPWAPRLRAYMENPRPVLALLELLKDDPVLYVRRSVANNLNDIAKDHPALTVEACRRWAENASPERAWIVRHALRSLVKAGNRDAIAILGGSANPQFRVTGIKIVPARLQRGGDVRLKFDVASTGHKSQRLLIDYAVHFVKASGKSSKKVFKLRTVTLNKNERISLEAVISTKEMTTRRHYPGRHNVEAMINGNAYPLGAFELTP